MAGCTEETADDDVISFELGDIFKSNNIKFDEINENDVPDALLAELLDHVQQGKDTIQENPTGHLLDADQSGTEPNRFIDLTDGEIDDLALNTCKKKTHKQTNWGVKVLRGK